MSDVESTKNKKRKREGTRRISGRKKKKKITNLRVNDGEKKTKKKRGGTHCVAFKCKKRKKDLKSPRSDSEGEADEESAIKRSLPIQ